MVCYGLDIDFEKFMVAHGDAANLCNEVRRCGPTPSTPASRTLWPRRCTRPITQLVSGTDVLVKARSATRATLRSTVNIPFAVDSASAFFILNQSGERPER